MNVALCGGYRDMFRPRIESPPGWGGVRIGSGREELLGAALGRCHRVQGGAKQAPIYLRYIPLLPLSLSLSFTTINTTLSNTPFLHTRPILFLHNLFVRALYHFLAHGYLHNRLLLSSPVASRSFLLLLPRLPHPPSTRPLSLAFPAAQQRSCRLSRRPLAG